MLKLEIAHLLIRPVGRPSHKPKVFYHSFRCQSKWGIPVLSSAADVDNLLIEMTCKQLSQNLHVYALSLNGDLAGRMTKLGVDEVICPYLFC